MARIITRLGQCPMSKEEWIEEMRNKNLIPRQLDADQATPE